MKKIVSSLLIYFIVFSDINCFAKGVWDAPLISINEMTSEISQEISPIKKGDGQLIGVDVKLIIPATYEGEEIIFVPDIFYSIFQYKSIGKGDKIKINLKVENNSKYDYGYVDNSFILATDDITRYGISDNFIDTKGVGFDGRKIYDLFSPYRTFNSALISLYNESFEKVSLDDYTLDLKLKEKGYLGISDVDKYYLDFYNNKYNLNNSSLDYFTYSVIKEIFSSEKSIYKETNPQVIELAYNFFYNKLLSYNFSLEEVNDSNSEDYSIGNYQRNNLGNSYFKNRFFNILSNSSNSIDDMSLNLSDNYTVSAFDNYILSGYMEFRLKKNCNKESEDVLIIVPPYTGI